MLQSPCLSDATERPDWDSVAALAGDDDPLVAIAVRPDLVRAPLMDDLPSGGKQCGSDLAVLLRHQIIQAGADVIDGQRREPSDRAARALALAHGGRAGRP